MERQEIPEGEGFFILTDYAAGKTVVVNDGAAVTQQMEKLQAGEQFRLEPVPPIPAEGLLLAAVNCVNNPEGDGILLVAMLRDPDGEEFTRGYLLSTSYAVDTEENGKLPLTSTDRALAAMVQLEETRRAPDFSRGWQPVRLSAANPEETRRMQAKEQQRAASGPNKGKKNW